MPRVQLRPYVPADAAPLRRLFVETVHAVNRRDYTPEQLAAWAPAKHDAAAWQRSFDGRFAVVAEIDGRLAGFADLERPDHVGRLYVGKDAQRLGVARRLYAALEAEARARGVRVLTVDASITALPFFERMGFGHPREQRVERRGVALTNYAVSKPLSDA